MTSALIIFAKNFIQGSVKTRLAATVGNEKAMEVYQQLFQHTLAVARHLSVKKLLFYSHYLGNEIDDNSKSFVQQGNGLGERMNHAFTTAFHHGYEKAVIIGTDVPGINSALIQKAFNQLNEVDVVIGPATDGGYYLLGMKECYPLLFQGIEWSTSTVFAHTLSLIKKIGLRYYILSTLSDVDVEDDLHLLTQLTN